LEIRLEINIPAETAEPIGRGPVTSGTILQMSQDFYRGLQLRP
jgi:hypothetical protein